MPDTFDLPNGFYVGCDPATDRDAIVIAKLVDGKVVWFRHFKAEALHDDPPLKERGFGK